MIDIFAPQIDPQEHKTSGVGRRVEKTIVIGDEIAIRSITAPTMKSDHKIMDISLAARLSQTRKHLEETMDLFGRCAR